MIKKLLSRPYHLFLLTAIVLFALSFFPFNNSLDFHVHDTYYIIDTASVNWGLSLFFWFLWMIYHFTYRFLFSNKLIWYHMVGAIISIAAIILFGQYQLSSYEFNNFNKVKQIGQIIAVAVIAIQFLYPINLVLGLIKPFKKR